MAGPSAEIGHVIPLTGLEEKQQGVVSLIAGPASFVTAL